MRRKKFGDQEIQHDGATERIVYARKLRGKKRNDDYTEYRSSFALNNGEYAYQDWDEDNQREFFHVVKIRDPNVFKLLDEADHDEEKDDRHAEEASDYAQLRYEAMAEAQEEEALASPLEKAEYTNTRKQKLVSVWKTDSGYKTLTGAKFALYKAEDYDDSAEGREMARPR